MKVFLAQLRVILENPGKGEIMLTKVRGLEGLVQHNTFVNLVSSFGKILNFNGRVRRPPTESSK